MVAPGLRFKQFKNQWASNKLEALVDSIQSGKSKDRAEDGKFPLFGSTGAIGMTNAPEYSGIAILIARVGANAGSKYLVDGNYSVTDNTLILRLKSGNDYDFFSNLLEYRKLNKLTFGSGQPLVTGGLLKQLEIKSPDPIEQTKIANFLTAIDAKISQLTKKYELLTSYKKGVTQKIFSQELRFKDDDGREFAEWKCEKLSKLAKIYDGTHMTPDYKELGIPFYSVEHLTSDNFQDTKYISEDVFKKENERVRLERGDILMTRIGDIGTSKYIDWEVNASFYVSLALIKSKNISTKYLTHFIRSYFFQKELYERTIHVAFPKKINLGEIGECQVLTPVEEEQTKIANFLTAIDDKITNVKSQLEAAKEYKQGLLQQMFV